jgi:HSP20 family molecular chaperone IbpA
MFALTPWRKRTRALARGEFPFGWEEFPAVFRRLFPEFAALEMPEWPAGWGMTTEKKEKEVVIRMEMPGFEPAEVKVEVTGNRLMVEAEHKEPAEKGEKGEEKPERAYVHAKRAMTLPPEIEPEKVEAVLRNGMLEIHLPRKAEAMRRLIEMKK